MRLAIDMETHYVEFQVEVMTTKSFGSEWKTVGRVGQVHGTFTFEPLEGEVFFTHDLLEIHRILAEFTKEQESKQ